MSTRAASPSSSVLLSVLSAVSVLVCALLGAGGAGAVPTAVAAQDTDEPGVESGTAIRRAVAGRMLIKLDHTAKTDEDAKGSLELVLSGTPAGMGASLESALVARGLRLTFAKRTLLSWIVVRLMEEGGEGAPDEVTDEVARLVASVKGVTSAERVRIAHALRVPNDDLYDFLWGFPAINLESAWESTVGETSQRIGIVDTGITKNHVDFSGRLVGGFDFISFSDISADGDARDGDATDDDPTGHFHGSHVAGTIGAKADDGIGVPGVNWNAKLVMARALSGQGGDTVDIAEASAWLAGADIDGVPFIGANRVSVINLSLGHDGSCSSFENDVYSQIIAAGVTVVAAAGNDGNDVPTTGPADCPGVIAVGAFGPDFSLSSYSNFDDRIDVVAPGGEGGAEEDGVLSVDGASTNDWKFLIGTSMATPHVVGVVSLMQAVNPQLSPRQIRQILLDSPFTCGGCDNHSMLMADDAVAQAAATVGELGVPSSSDGNDGNGGGNGGSSDPTEGNGNCPAHSTLLSSPDGNVCQCDSGFVVNDAQTACVLPGDESGDSGSCNPERGNWDCAKGSGCVDGTCVPGAQGQADLGEECHRDNECDSGLCADGICTRPCDSGSSDSGNGGDTGGDTGGDNGGCSEGQTCDADAIPGGLCVLSQGRGGCSEAGMPNLVTFFCLLGGVGIAKRRALSARKGR